MLLSYCLPPFLFIGFALLLFSLIILYHTCTSMSTLFAKVFKFVYLYNNYPHTLYILPCAKSRQKTAQRQALRRFFCWGFYGTISKRKGGIMYGYGYEPQSYYDMLRAQMYGQQMPRQPQPQSNVLPAQQVIQVAGRQSIDTLQMSPNSSVLIMDTSAPIVWLCVSDGLGKVTATAYDITVHQDTPPFDVAGFAGDVEKRLQALEKHFVEVDINAGKPDATDARSGKANDWKVRRD